MSWLGLFVNLTQPKVILEEGISIEKKKNAPIRLAFGQVCGAFSQ